MAIDNQVKSGSPDSYKDNRDGGVLFPHPVIGIVKDNVDKDKNGRIRVYLTNYGGPDPDDDNNWVTVSYMSPWFGSTQGSASPSEDGKYLTNPHSYGFWATAPDIGTKVICIFIEGKPNQGYYMGSIPTPGGHHMTPGIAAASTVIPNQGEAGSYGGADRLPVTEINLNNPKYKDDPNQNEAAKPIHSYQAGILFNQGTIRDNVRGVTNSSSMRESPSSVFGISTPGGPIWEGGYTRQNIAAGSKNADSTKLKVVGRQGGHSLVMDDGELLSGKNQMIRLRSSAGHQITMSDDEQVLFITHSNGQSWVELGPEGTVDIYSTNSFNVRTQGDINLHADRDINMNAGGKIKMRGDSIAVETVKDLVTNTGGDKIDQTGGSYVHRAFADIAFESVGFTSMKSAAPMFFTGSLINLNTGVAPTLIPPVLPMGLVSHPETTFSDTKGWMYPAPTPLVSTVTRAPTHQPFIGSGKGVLINTKPGGNGPTDPISQVTEATAAAVDAASQTVDAANQVKSAGTFSADGLGADPLNPLKAATVAAIDTATNIGDVRTTPTIAQTAPSLPTGTNAILPMPTLQSMVSMQSTVAANMTDTQKTANGVMPGLSGLTYTQAENAGVLKMGTANSIQGMASRGVPPEQLLNSASLTGKMGINSLTALIDCTIQPNVVAASINNAGNELVKIGLITGTESPTQIAGVVYAASQTSSGGVATAILRGITKANAALNRLIAQATYAAQMADQALSGIQSLARAISSLPNLLTTLLANRILLLQGIARQAFAKVEASYLLLKAGLPNALRILAAVAIEDLRQRALRLFSTARLELAQAEVDLFNARKEYFANKTPENLQKVREAEARVAAAKRKLGLASSDLLSTAGTGLSTTTTVTTNTTLVTVPNTTNSGINALPGGNAAVSAQTVASIPGCDVVNVNAGVVSVNTDTAGNGATNYEITQTNVNKATVNDVGNIPPGSDVDIELESLLVLIAFIFAGIRPVALATGTFKAFSQLAATAKNLADPRIPPIQTKPLSVSTATTAEQVDASIATKTQALAELNAAYAELSAAEASATPDNAASTAKLKEIQARVTKAQAAYDAANNS